MDKYVKIIQEPINNNTVKYINPTPKYYRNLKSFDIWRYYRYSIPQSYNKVYKGHIIKYKEFKKEPKVF